MLQSNMYTLIYIFIRLKFGNIGFLCWCTPFSLVSRLHLVLPCHLESPGGPWIPWIPVAPCFPSGKTMSILHSPVSIARFVIELVVSTVPVVNSNSHIFNIRGLRNRVNFNIAYTNRDFSIDFFNQIITYINLMFERLVIVHQTSFG